MQTFCLSYSLHLLFISHHSPQAPTAFLWTKKELARYFFAISVLTSLY
ncbi:hypothetical protein AT1219_40349 [Vibrio alginolyticus]